MRNFTDEECRLFTERIMKMGEEWYKYMHGERTEPDGPKAVLQRHLQLFEGDWIGLIDYDMAMGVWSTKCFYNANTESTTDTLIGDAEGAEQALRWLKAIQTGEPIIISDIEDIKDEAPAEYAMYKRLKVHSVLAVPYRNCGSGLMVVRNPKYFTDNYVALNVMSYIATNEIVAFRRNQHLARKLSPYIPDTHNEIRLNLFGKFEIVGNNLHLTEDEVATPIIFLLAYLACNKGKSVSQEMLLDLYDDETVSWKNQIYRFRKQWKEFEGREGDENQLIITTDKGYTLNPKLEVIADADYVLEAVKSIEDQSDAMTKTEMIKQFKALYRGPFLESLPENTVFISEKRMKYKTIFNEKMVNLLKLLYGQKEYDSLERYSVDLLEISPECVGLYVWRVAGLATANKTDLMNYTLDMARNVLEPKDYKDLCSRFLKIVNADKLKAIVGKERPELLEEYEQLMEKSALYAGIDPFRIGGLRL